MRGISDFICSGGNANDAILVEIKTPTTNLLGRKYRKNVFAPSVDLTGAIVQVNDYCHTFRKNIETPKRPGANLNAFNPRRVIIIGNHHAELNDEKKIKSFELFRTTISGIDVITFDELFAKVEQLAKMFSLVRAATAPSG